MQRDDFVLESPGELVEVTGGALAFLPRNLPPELPLTRTLLVKVEEARGALGSLTGQAQLVDNVDLIIGALARREAVLSSRLEGTHTQIGELLLQDALDAPPAEDSDLQEVVNYLATIRLAQSWLAEGRRLGLPFVRGLHQRLLQGVRGQGRHPGEVRRVNVYIGDKGLGMQAARFVPPPAEQVDPLLESLFAYISSDPAYSPLIDAALVHYQFETIHPFEDGNGRLGRLLVPLQLLDKKVIDRPLLYLGAYFEAHEDEYRDGLLRVSTHGRWGAWVELFLDAVKASADDARQRVQKLMDLRKLYEAAVISVSSSQAPLTAIGLVMRRVYVSVGDIERHAHVTYPTARAAIDTLVSLGVLAPIGRIQGRQMWQAAQLQREVYED